MTLTFYIKPQSPPDNSGTNDTCHSFNGGNTEDYVIANPASRTWFFLGKCVYRPEQIIRISTQ